MYKLKYDLTQEEYSEMVFDVIKLAKGLAESNEFIYIDIQSRDSENPHHVSCHVKLKTNSYIDSFMNTTEAFVDMVEQSLPNNYYVSWNNNRSIFGVWKKK